MGLEPIHETTDSPAQAERSDEVEPTTHMNSMDNKASRLEEFGTEFLEPSC